MRLGRAFAAAVVCVGVAGTAFAFEFEPLDAGSEVPVVDSAGGAAGARSLASARRLPLLRAGTVGGRVAVQGMFENRGERVYFESRRSGPARDASVLGLHPFEIDVCFRDKDGLPLFASIAGDEPLISDCTPESASEQLAAHPELLTGFNRSYAGMKRATRAIEGVTFASQLAFEQQELVHPARRAARLLKLRKPVESILPPPAADGAAPPGPAGAAQLDSGVASGLQPRAAVWWKHMLGVWTGPAFNVTPFEHTATIAYVAYSFDRNFAWALFSWESRNHGRHWYEAGMRSKCSYHSGFDRGPSIWHQQCGTVYNPTSLWGHNCNDDALLQMWSIKFNRFFSDLVGYPCNDPGLNLFTPMCFRNG